MKRSRKLAANLERRMADYSRMMDNPQNKDQGPTKRRDGGGYHRPGSNTK